MLVVCLARPELLDARPGWTSGEAEQLARPLEPLSEAEMSGLIQNLLGSSGLEPGHDTDRGLAEGNPLFAEETLRMLVDDGVLQPEEDGWVVDGRPVEHHDPADHPRAHHRPARPARPGGAARHRVRGRHRAGVLVERGVQLCGPEGREHVTGHLRSLTRKELIRPEHPEAGQEDAFRFAHILVRDAAYNAMPKALRAELHERLADWLEVDARDRAGEYEEILGFHLEQGRRLLLELGLADERAEALGGRAAALQAAAGRRAFARGDMPAAVKPPLARAVELLPENEPERLDLLPQLGARALRDRRLRERSSG